MMTESMETEPERKRSRYQISSMVMDWVIIIVASVSIASIVLRHGWVAVVSILLGMSTVGILYMMVARHYGSVMSENIRKVMEMVELVDRECGCITEDEVDLDEGYRTEMLKVVPKDPSSN